MYDINTKVIKKGNKLSIIFFIVGVIILVVFGAIVISGFKKSRSMDATVMSTRVEIQTHYDSDDGNTMYSPTYYYRVDGKEYACPSTSSSSIRPSEENKIVYYDSKNPANCINSYSKSSNKLFLLILILPIVFIVIAIVNSRKIKKRVKLVEELNQRGKLVKNLPYRLEDTNVEVNGRRIQRPVVDYMLPTGTTLTLKGDPRYDNKTGDGSGYIDLVIDEANPDNYFIDFNINRLTGNSPSDYYRPNNTEVQPNNNYLNINNMENQYPTDNNNNTF